jgi:hypothetical protein
MKIIQPVVTFMYTNGTDTHDTNGEVEENMATGDKGPKVKIVDD